jgi:hypothetical protein
MDRGAFHMPHHAHAMPAQLPLAAFGGQSPRQSLAQPPGLTVPWGGGGKMPGCSFRSFSYPTWRYLTCLPSLRPRSANIHQGSNYIIVLHLYNLQLSSQQSQGCYLADGQLTPNNLVARNFRLVPQEEVPGWGCWIHGGLDLDRENRKKLTN